MHRLLGQQRFAFPVIQVLRPIPLALQSGLVGLRDDAKVDLCQVAVPDLNRRQRLVPDAFGGDLRGLGLDLLDQVMAAPPADAVGKCVRAALGQLPGLDKVAFLVHDRGPLMKRPGGDFVVAPLVRESFQGRLVARVFLLAERFVVAKVQSQQIRVDECGLVVVVLMELQQVLIQSNRLDDRGILVSGLNLPSHEVVGRSEDGAIGHQIESILWLGRRLFARAVEFQRIMRQDVEHGGSIGVRHVALLQQLVEIGDRRRFQLVFGRKRLGELLVDFRENPRQVPRSEIVTRRFGRGGTAHETPAILLEIVPIPIGQNGVHRRHHFVWCFGNLGLHASDLFLRLVALDAALQCDLLTDRLDRLGIRLVFHGTGDDRIEMLDRRLGQPLTNSLIHLLPLVVARTAQCWDRENESEQD